MKLVFPRVSLPTQLVAPGSVWPNAEKLNQLLALKPIALPAVKLN
jgi:hypothetical protein